MSFQWWKEYCHYFSKRLWYFISMIIPHCEFPVMEGILPLLFKTPMVLYKYDYTTLSFQWWKEYCDYFSKRLWYFISMIIPHCEFPVMEGILRLLFKTPMVLYKYDYTTLWVSSDGRAKVMFGCVERCTSLLASYLDLTLAKHGSCSQCSAFSGNEIILNLFPFL